MSKTRYSRCEGTKYIYDLLEVLLWWFKQFMFQQKGKDMTCYDMTFTQLSVGGVVSGEVLLRPLFCRWHISIITLLSSLCLSELLAALKNAFLKPYARHKTGLEQILIHPSLINNLQWLIVPGDRECIAVVYQIAVVSNWGVICLGK